MLSEVCDWLEAAGGLSFSYSNNVPRIHGGWEEYTGFLARLGWKVEKAGTMFWVCEGGRVHQGGIVALARAGEGRVDTSVVVIPNVGGNPSVTDCGCKGSPGEGWGGQLLGQIPF